MNGLAGGVLWNGFPFLLADWSPVTPFPLITAFISGKRKGKPERPGKLSHRECLDDVKRRAHRPTHRKAPAARKRLSHVACPVALCTGNADVRTVNVPLLIVVP
jgi:hypothetical protein